MLSRLTPKYAICISISPSLECRRKGWSFSMGTKKGFAESYSGSTASHHPGWSFEWPWNVIASAVYKASHHHPNDKLENLTKTWTKSIKLNGGTASESEPELLDWGWGYNNSKKKSICIFCPDPVWVPPHERMDQRWWMLCCCRSCAVSKFGDHIVVILGPAVPSFMPLLDRTPGLVGAVGFKWN